MDPTYQSLILEYLVHNCYKDTAKALLKDTCEIEDYHDKTVSNARKKVEDDPQWTLLDARKNIIAAIEHGDINLAFALIEKSFPRIAMHTFVPNGIAPPNDSEAARIHNVLFQLMCQQFIEIIRNSTAQQALLFAKTNLRPTNETTKKQLEEVTTLIAYADPYQSQVGYLLGQERREKIAAEINNILLAHCNLPIQTSMEKISRQMLLVEEELAKVTDESPNDIKEKMSIRPTNMHT